MIIRPLEVKCSLFEAGGGLPYWCLMQSVLIDYFKQKIMKRKILICSFFCEKLTLRVVIGKYGWI